MQNITTITPNFQIHIPASVRRKIGLERPGRAIITADKKTITIKPLKETFLALGGSLKVKNPTPAEDIRKVIDYAGDKK